MRPRTGQNTGAAALLKSSYAMASSRSGLDCLVLQDSPAWLETNCRKVSRCESIVQKSYCMPVDPVARAGRVALLFEWHSISWRDFLLGHRSRSHWDGAVSDMILISARAARDMEMVFEAPSSRDPPFFRGFLGLAASRKPGAGRTIGRVCIAQATSVSCSSKSRVLNATRTSI